MKHLLALLLCVGGVPAGVADVVIWSVASGGNGHGYEFISAPTLPWADARAAAELHVFEGVAGHLATITSAEENDFILNNVLGTPGPFYWIGGAQNPAGVEPGGGWEWVTGESWGYTNWGNYSVDPEPNNAFGTEDVLEMRSDGKWNDYTATAVLEGSIIEYDALLAGVRHWEEYN